MMYARNLASLLVALPHQRKGLDTPEMSRLRLIFAVVYGALYWVALELPLWMCWGLFILYTVLLIAVELGTQGSAYPKELIFYVGYPLIFGFVGISVLTMLLTILRTLLLIVRLAMHLIKALRS